MRAILGFIAFLAIIIFVVVVIVRGGNDTPINDAPVASLAEVASSDASFNFVNDGPINAEEDHYQVRISISRWTRKIDVVQGYQNTVVASQTFSNNEPAFSQFLSAIDRAGYTKERGTKVENEQGICPTGSRYIFESDQYAQDFKRWTTTCQEKGNFGGAFSIVRELFQDQIPEYNKFISDTRKATGLSL